MRHPLAYTRSLDATGTLHARLHQAPYQGPSRTLRADCWTESESTPPSIILVLKAPPLINAIAKPLVLAYLQRIWGIWLPFLYSGYPHTAVRLDWLG